MKTAGKKVFQKQIEGDIYTPIAIFQSLPGEKKFLLESSMKHEQHGRYSFIGTNPYMEMRAYGMEVTIQSGNEILTENGRFLDVLEKYLPQENLSDQPFPLMGGAVGYVGYDIIRQYEEIGEAPFDELNMPEAHLLFYSDIIVYDHISQKISIVHIGDAETEANFNERAEGIAAMIEQGPKPSSFEKISKSTIDFQSNMTQQQFEEKVKKAKEEIEKGEIFQVVLSQRFSTAFAGDPFYFYRSLRTHNPSPYMFYIDFHDYQIVGASPESLLKGDGVKIVTNPIAGTRKRGRTAEEDTVLEIELLQDEKELAEHRMLVDLGRNDLGRVCEIGSVELTKYMVIEKYKHVMHIVSEVVGSKRADISNGQVLASCLPAGTVSGAPKIRAMSIINELEKVKRGVYAGAVGYFSNHGSFDFALAIRTMIVKDGQATIQAGAGIVYDSDPDMEHNEVLNKARAFMEVEL
ncbi:anthranilate synthase component I [Bacillus sp. AGMB 02131]|uniref:Anthranilate synthase component 1 n=1 Tax=Peribacillus faecalis TaxID=2772559 RepID=A0A927CXK0_9BACI|nr:anthranilate synthase component I [Peribacillus faecalis]MBD3109498.1 anthranilate synthase component I [Peribacillus faecalis]